MVSICFLTFDVRMRIYTQGRTTKNKHTRILCNTEFVFNRQISCKRATLLFSMAIVREQRETVFWEHQLFTITATRKDRMLTKKISTLQSRGHWACSIFNGIKLHHHMTDSIVLTSY